MNRIQIKNNCFYKNNEKINIYSGSIHYFRILPEYWYDRLLKLKLAGFNTVETYIPWNLHEPQKGTFCFECLLDFEKFIKIATSLDLLIILRPGPYICAEIDLGGLPSWLLKNKDSLIRCYDKKFLKNVDEYYDVLFPKIVPYLATNGGNVIALQIENEYGSYGYDKKYLMYLKNAFIKRKMDVLLFTSDGPLDSMIEGGSIDGLLETMNFGSRAKDAFTNVERLKPGFPKMCGEFWVGWFDQFGVEQKKRDPYEVIKEINDLLDMDANFNIYMFIGGTNFNFWAGANYYDKFYATTASYDYGALLTEYGDYTPLYHLVRESLLKKQNLPYKELPDSPKLQMKFGIAPTGFASFWDNVHKISKQKRSIMPMNVEYYGLDYGYIVYETIIKCDYEDVDLRIEEVRDIAYVYLDDEMIVRFSNLEEHEAFQVHLEKVKKGSTLKILVDFMGRINFGHKLNNYKGIEKVVLGYHVLTDFKVYLMNINQINHLNYKKHPVKCPVFIKYVFKMDSKNDCYVDISGFTKGFVLVNGFNIGKYYNVLPYHNLYLPGVLLKEENEIIVFEQEYVSNMLLNLVNHRS